MKHYIILFISLFCITTGHGQVRKTKWGMNKQQVIYSEDIKPAMNDKNGLGYEIKLSGFNTHLFYFFNPDGKLSAAVYNLAENFASENSYLTAYYDLLSKLKEKYGDGEYDIEWSDDLYKDDKKKWGFAISAEHLKISHRWETDDTKIISEISGKNFEISVAIRYLSKEIQYRKKTNELDNF